MSIVINIATIVAPIFVIAGIGYLWGRSGRPFDTNMIGMLVVNFGVPCLIFSTLTKLKVSVAAFGEVAAIYILALAIAMAVSATVMTLTRQDVGAFLPGLTFANNGNMGLPLCLFAFGEEGLALGFGVFVVTSVGNFVIGSAIISGRVSPGEIARTPHLYFIAAALVFMVAGWQPPRWLASTTDIIGGISIPLMLIALGVSLSRLRVSDIPRAVTMAALRIGLGFAIGVSLAWAFGLEGLVKGVLILQCSMPTAVINYILAARYQREEEAVAGLVVASTVISFVTLPFLIWFVI